MWGLDLEDIEKGGRIIAVKSVSERNAVEIKSYFMQVTFFTANYVLIY
jgi:hypothetical protein